MSTVIQDTHNMEISTHPKQEMSLQQRLEFLRTVNAGEKNSIQNFQRSEKRLENPQAIYEQQSQGFLQPQNFTNPNNLPPIPESFIPQSNIPPQINLQTTQKFNPDLQFNPIPQEIPTQTFEQPVFGELNNQNPKPETAVSQVPENQIQPLIRKEIKTEQAVVKNNIVPLQKIEAKNPKNVIAKLLNIFSINKNGHPNFNPNNPNKSEIDLNELRLLQESRH